MNSILQNKKLSTLHIIRSNVNDAMVNVIANHPNVTILDLVDNNIHDAGALALAKNSYEYLDVRFNHIGKAGLEALISNPVIKELLYYGNDGDDANLVSKDKQTPHQWINNIIKHQTNKS